MTTLREAAQQALEALEGWDNYGKWVWPESALEQAKRNTTESLTALRAALAEPVQEPDSPERRCGGPGCDMRCCQPVQEPVAWMVYTEGGTSAYVTDNPNDLVGAYRALALYTAPQQRPAEPVTDKCICNHSPLTDDQLDDIAVAARRGNLYDLRIAIERALKIGGTE